MQKPLVRIELTLRGIVQGVGFRPFVYRLASEFGICGYVYNFGPGVFIAAQGTSDQLTAFKTHLKENLPPHASITQWNERLGDVTDSDSFFIAESPDGFQPEADILPDLAVCPDCLKELFDPADPRYRYPFINCTHCGPRFSIIKHLPYDRPGTTMAVFTLCPFCRDEYHSPINRRFHAQPVACPACGPGIWLEDSTGMKLAEGESALQQAIKTISDGGILALKGLGGFQLIVRADSTAAVNNLRSRKNRPHKPFAVMVRDLEMVKTLAHVNKQEEALITVQNNPIVLLRSKNAEWVSQRVHPDNPWIGILLPTTPIHHLLMRDFDFPIVATSGNLSEEPICIDNDEALSRLGKIADVFLMHNRPIQRPVDDSVARVVDGKVMMIRRARGYAPLPFYCDSTGPKDVVAATGAHLKNTFSIIKDHKIYTSQHIGDLSSPEAVHHFQAISGDLPTLYDTKPQIIIHDNHPDYLSTVWAEKQMIPTAGVQHHVAHAAAVRLEHKISGPALAVIWDGTGLGTDRTIWGSEFFLTTETECQSIGRLLPFHLPGGDSSAKEPWKPAIALLTAIYGNDFEQIQSISANWPVSSEKIRLFYQLCIQDKPANCSSMGRLFDAVSAITGFSYQNGFEGQAPMLLEFGASVASGFSLSFEWMESATGIKYLDWRPTIRHLISARRDGLSRETLASRFHSMLSMAICDFSSHYAEHPVLLSGGCFQNFRLLTETIERLKESGKSVYFPQQYPANDGSISFGQIAAYLSGNVNRR